MVCNSVNYPETRYMDTWKDENSRKKEETLEAEIQGQGSLPYRNLNQLTKIIANLDILFKGDNRKRIIQMCKYTVYHRCHFMI